MKLAVIYDSKTGNTKLGAEWIAAGMKEVEGVEVQIFSIQDADADYLKEAKGMVVGSPSYGTAMTPAMHAWLLEKGMVIGFGGKLGGAFATEQFTHGGGDLVLQEILKSELVSGMICYSGGGSCGQPFIHLGPVGVNNNKESHNGMELYKDYFTVYGKRFAAKAAELFG